MRTKAIQLCKLLRFRTAWEMFLGRMALPESNLAYLHQRQILWTHHPHGSKECRCGWPVHTTLTRTADATATADAYGLHGLGALHYYACSAFHYSIV
jgi:hypothetical protein